MRERLARFPLLSADGLPIIGRSGRHRGLFYLFGFSSSGMINAPAAAKALSELMHGGRSDIDLEPFSIGRFGASLRFGRRTGRKPPGTVMTLRQGPLAL
jgi:glycine/D-amino acid oxidase-like deaminating enzyme